jgi:spoIIIJ-associated protein
MSAEVTAEATGETVGEAKWAAVRELERKVPGLDREGVRFQVLSEGERGLLGVGYSPARVLAATDAAGGPTQAPPPAPREAGQAGQVRELLERVVAEAGVAATVRVADGDGELTAELVGSDLGVLIGRHGQTIDALQYLANAMGHRAFGDERRVVLVDAAGYRARRAVTLESVARRAAEQAAASGERVALDPMTAVERRIVHELLKDDPTVETASDGSEPYRYVIVTPRPPSV